MFAVSPPPHDFFHQCLSSCHSSIKGRFVERPLIVVLWTDSPPWAVQLLQSYHGASWLLLWWTLSLPGLVSLGGRPCLGRFAVVPYSFHFPMMDWTEAQWDLQSLGDFFITSPCFIPLHNFIPDLSGVFLGLHDAVCSLRFSKKNSEDFTEQLYLYWD